MITDYLGMVREFHEKFGHHTQQSPEAPPLDVLELRRKLITEEADEYRLASGHLEVYRKHQIPYADYSTDLIEIADALADILYVVFGTALAFGIPIADVFAEVHRSNMTKSMEKDEKSVKGKTLKGPTYEPPNIRKALGLW